MRTFEILLICLTVIGLVIGWRGRVWVAARVERSGAKWLVLTGCLLPALTLIAHLVWEGAHWQMYPAYLAAGLAMLLLMSKDGGRLLRAMGLCLGLLLCGVSCVAAVVLPMFQLPTPTGPYLIGTSILKMTDNNRREDRGVDLTIPREVVVQIWYPASRSHKDRAAYRRRSETSLASSYQSVDWTHARMDAPVADIGKPFPIVLYNPGWNGRRTQDSFLLEDLASHGYVVAAIDHPYNSGPVDLGGGRVIRFGPTPEFTDNSSSKEAIYAVIDKEVEKETADTLFVLTRLKGMNLDRASLFFGALDMAKVGALGYSLGGAVAAEAAYQSAEIQSVIDLDTPLYGEAGKHGIAKPFLLLSEDLSHSTEEERARMSFGQRRNVEMDEDDYARQLPLLAKPGDYQIAIHGTLHTSFQDGILSSPVRSISGVGSIDARRMVLILRAYTVAFFEQTLRGIPSALLSKPSPFQEATVMFPAAAGERPMGKP